MPNDTEKKPAAPEGVSEETLEQVSGGGYAEDAGKRLEQIKADLHLNPTVQGQTIHEYMFGDAAFYQARRPIAPPQD